MIQIPDEAAHALANLEDEKSVVRCKSKEALNHFSHLMTNQCWIINAKSDNVAGPQVSQEG